MRSATLLFFLASAVCSAGAPEDLAQGIALYESRQPAAALVQINKVVTDVAAPARDRARGYLYGALCRAHLGEVEAARKNFWNAFALDPSLELPAAVAPETLSLAAATRAVAISALKTRIAAGADAAQAAMAAPRPPPAPVKSK